MKRSVVIPVAVGVLLIGVLAIFLVPAREPVSLALVQYHRWPHGATLKLTNNSSKNIAYLADAGAPLLFCQKTEKGWSNTSPNISQLRLASYIQNGVVVIDTNLYFIGVLGNSTNAGFTQPLRARELKPGRSTELYLILEPDGPPIRAGTVCIIPRGKLVQQFGQWMVHIKRWFHLKSNLSGQIEVWCNEPLQVSLRPTRAERQ
jgi:hypothetical protein